MCAIRVFGEFEEIELWEVLRISVWREVADKVALIREGDSNRVFGFIVTGFVEVSIEGKSLCRLGAGEVVGEMAYLHPSDTKRSASVVTLEPTLFLEINSAALDLASEELQERFRKALMTTLLARMRAADRALARSGPPAVQGRGMACDLELAPL
jgi:non-specific serine/threonine protein kinase